MRIQPYSGAKTEFYKHRKNEYLSNQIINATCHLIALSHFLLPNDAHNQQKILRSPTFCFSQLKNYLSDKKKEPHNIPDKKPTLY